MNPFWQRKIHQRMGRYRSDRFTCLPDHSIHHDQQARAFSGLAIVVLIHNVALHSSTAVSHRNTSNTGRERTVPAVKTQERIE
ncbi:MAG: hypothetical protein P1V21_05210 [Rhizobiaceae bacterium]|nr:hypothetical protein [Rhizobiaceae bacterium]